MNKGLTIEQQQALKEYLKKIVDYCMMSQGLREMFILIQNDLIDHRMGRIEMQLKEIQDTIGKFKHSG